MLPRFSLSSILFQTKLSIRIVRYLIGFDKHKPAIQMNENGEYHFVDNPDEEEQIDRCENSIARRENYSIPYDEVYDGYDDEYDYDEEYDEEGHDNDENYGDSDYESEGDSVEEEASDYGSEEEEEEEEGEDLDGEEEEDEYDLSEDEGNDYEANNYVDNIHDMENGGVPETQPSLWNRFVQNFK